jgi:hypothetical protein
MTAFKKGDRVRCIEGNPSNRLTAGEVYTVRCCRPQYFTLRQCDSAVSVEGDAGVWAADRFELVERYAFKKGDHVRCVTTDAIDGVNLADNRLVRGQEYIVVGTGTSYSSVRVEGINYSFFRERFELVEPEKHTVTVTLELDPALVLKAGIGYALEAASDQAHEQVCAAVLS